MKAYFGRLLYKIHHHRNSCSVFCRYKGYHDYAKSKGLDVSLPVGLDVIVDGTVPTGILSLLTVQCVTVNQVIVSNTFFERQIFMSKMFPNYIFFA